MSLDFRKQKGQDEAVKKLAEECLNNSKGYERRYALSYLLWNYPEMFSSLKDKYKADDAPGVVFALAEYIAQKGDSKEAIQMMRNILPLVAESTDHEVYDAIQLWIEDDKKRK